MTFGSLFCGIGGIDLGLERAGMECRWQVEIDPYALKVLTKHWPNVPKHGDIQTVKGEDLEPVDLICGGFPCQDVSYASQTSTGIIGARSGLWKEFARIIGEVRPAFVLVENVPALRNRGLALVLQDFWALGYDAEWHCIPACAFGAPHERDRIWIIAYTAGRFAEPIITGMPDDIEQGISDFGWWTATDINGFGCDWGAGDAGQARGTEFENSDPLADADRPGLEEWLRFAGNSGQEQQAAFGGDLCAGEADADFTSNGCGSGRKRRSYPGAEGEQPGACTCSEANPDGERELQPEGLEQGFGGWTFDQSSEGFDADAYSEPLVGAAIARGERHAWTSQPGVVRMVHGTPHRVDRLGRLGNGVVPQIPEWLGSKIMRADKEKP